MKSCNHYRWLEENESLPDDGGFPAAEELFADAFALHVGDSQAEARHFVAGWLHDGLDRHNLRDTFAHFDRLSPQAVRLATEALVQAWDVSRDVDAFSRVLCHLAQGVPESHLLPALEGMGRALAHAPELRAHEVAWGGFHSRIAMRTEAGRAAWAQAGERLFPPRAEDERRDPGGAQAGERKRKREDKGRVDDPSCGSTSTSPEPHVTEADLRAQIVALMCPPQPLATPPAGEGSEKASPKDGGYSDSFDSPPRKKGFTPRGRWLTA